MSSHQYLTEEQNQTRLEGLRVLARIIVCDLVSRPAQGSDSVADGPHSAEKPSVEGGSP